jgi:hypothetical protein
MLLQQISWRSLQAANKLTSTLNSLNGPRVELEAPGEEVLGDVDP